MGEVFLPDALIGKDEDFARRWLQEQEQTSTRKRQEIRDTEIAARAARDELSRLISGEKVHELERRRAELMKVRDDLQSKLAELSREQPAGIIARIFKGGRSGASIGREMSLIGDRLSSLDRQIDENSRHTEQAQSQTTTMIQEVQERIQRLEKAIGSLNEDFREIEGSVFDVELALEHLPLGN